MCTPKAAMISQASSDLAGMAGSIVNMRHKSAAAKAQRKLNERKQFALKRQAANAITQGREQGQMALQQNALQRGAQRVAFAKSNVSTATGSAARQLQDMAQLGRANAQQAQFQGQSGAQNSLQSIHDLKAENAMIKAKSKSDRISGAFSLLGGSLTAGARFGSWKSS